MRKMPRNPFQDRINSLNLKDLEEGLKIDSYLKKSSDPIPDDINNQVFPQTDFPQVNVLKPEELSMKDLLDEIQIQTILNNNTVPFVEKKIKSEVTQEMIKDFQNESAKPVNINGTLYKFRPPDLEIKLKDLPPEFPDEATYKAEINRIWTQEVQTYAVIRKNLSQLVDQMERINIDYSNGRISDAEFMKARNHYEVQIDKLEQDRKQIEMTLDSLQKDYDDYEEKRLENVALIDKIKKENKQNLTAYEDEIKSRNTGMEVAQQEGESDADFAQRMIDTAHTTVDPSQVELQAKLYLFNTMKDRMNELMPAYKSEEVLKIIIQHGGYEKLQSVKDSWTSVRKLLVDTYGNVGQAENMDNVAQLMYNYSPKAVVRPAAMTSSATPIPLVPTPNVSPTSSNIPSYSITSKPKASTYFTKYHPTPTSYVPIPPAPPQMSQYISYSPAPAPRALVPTPSSYPVRPKAPRIDPLSVPLEQSYAKMGGSKKMVPFSKITNAELVDVLTQFGITPVKHGADMKAKNYDLVVKNGIVIRPSESPSEEPTIPVTQSPDILIPRLTRSRSKETKLPIELMTYDELTYILDRNGLPFLTGNDVASKKQNYLRAQKAGLIPDRPQLEPFSVIKGMSTPHLQQYLDEKGVRGLHGGDPFKTKSRDILYKMYLRYATPELKGNGVSDIKSSFEIVDGEIQSGNNNPQLMRDAKKLLKEMVQQKMITLYEAQSHMKHLRKMNKI